jgi:hypothetical protein
VAALSEGGGLDPALFLDDTTDANGTGIVYVNASNNATSGSSNGTLLASGGNTSSSSVIEGGFSVASDPAQLVNYIKVAITGGCAAVMLVLSTALRSVMLTLAAAAFGSLMFAGGLSGIVGGGMISLSGFMNGTFGA